MLVVPTSVLAVDMGGGESGESGDNQGDPSGGDEGGSGSGGDENTDTSEQPTGDLPESTIDTRQPVPQTAPEQPDFTQKQEKDDNNDDGILSQAAPTEEDKMIFSVINCGILGTEAGREMNSFTQQHIEKCKNVSGVDGLGAWIGGFVISCTQSGKTVEECSKLLSGTVALQK